MPVLESIAAGIAEQYSSKPSPESVARRAAAQREQLLKAVAARLVERAEDLEPSEIEFIVQFAPEVAGKAAPALYQAAEKAGASHIVDALRDLWALYGSPTKAPCPRCGFKALTPDYTCIVCGASVGEEEFKRHVGFDRLLESWASRAPAELVEEARRAGYVYYEDDEVKAPSEPGSPLRVQVFLSKREREALERVLASRRSPSSSRPQASPGNTS